MRSEGQKPGVLLSTRRQNCSEPNISCYDNAVGTRNSAIGPVVLARLPQQRQNNLFSFLFVRQMTMRLPRLTVPVAGVSLVALPAVEIGVDPGPIT